MATRSEEEITMERWRRAFELTTYVYTGGRKNGFTSKMYVSLFPENDPEPDSDVKPLYLVGFYMQYDFGPVIAFKQAIAKDIMMDPLVKPVNFLARFVVRRGVEAIRRRYEEEAYTPSWPL